jgi:outer membrane protein assembly factor BamB
MRPTPLVIAAALFLGSGVSSYALSYSDPSYSPPGVYGNTLIFSHDSGYCLYAVDKTAKKTLWVWRCGGRVIRTEPTIVDDVAYIWAGHMIENSRACAVDCKTGKSLWETPARGWSLYPAAVANDVVLFDGDGGEGTCAFDRQSGKRLWARANCDMMLVHDMTVLTSMAMGTRLELLDVRTGETVFEATLSDEAFLWPRADCNAAGQAVIACSDTLLKLSIPDRKILWRKPTPGERWVPTVHDDQIYLLSYYAGEQRSGRLQLCSLRDGTIRRQTEWDSDGYARSQPQVFEKIIVVAIGRTILGLDRQTLKEKWRVDTGLARSYKTKKHDDKVYVGGEGPYLWEVDPATGEKLWVYEEMSQSTGPSGEK